MLGKMLHPYELAVPKLVTRVPVQKAGKWEQEDVPTPAILTSSWQSASGQVGHLFVNISETTQPLHVDLDTRNVSVSGSFDAEIYRSTQRASFKPLWQNVPLPAEFATELAPLEVVFVELRQPDEP